jgi:nucleotide-binding universal stress UspA family protein
MPQIARILVAVDFSPGSQQALDLAGEVARRFAAEVAVLHVDEALSVIPGSDLAETRRVAAEHALEDATAELRRKDVRARPILRSGLATIEIVEAAHAEHADLVVLGTHGRTGLAHVLLGSVAERVVRTAPCPVLTVRTVAPAAGTN